MAVVLFVLAAVVSYLLGSISFAVIIAQKFIKRDVRDLGSGNAGMTNVMRSAGFLPGILTFLLDVLKAAVACLIGKYLIFGTLAQMAGVENIPAIYGALFCGLFCQVGHIFPLFFQFKGGKAVACTAGIFAVCNWKVLVISLTVFLILFIITRIISAGSIAAMITGVTVQYFTAIPEYRLTATLLTSAIALIVIIKHKDNIVRLIKGEEKKLVIKEDKAE